MAVAAPRTLKQSIHIFQRTNTLVKIFIKQTAKQNAERQSSVSSHQRRVSIGRISLTPIMTMGRNRTKTKLGCQTVGLGKNKPPTNSTVSHESSNFISVTGDFQSTRKRSTVKKNKKITDAARATSETYGRSEDF